ncbi:MAG: protein-export chaperone SecB [Gammaproteobacteria bacterium]|nr:protein-export chaperone SecB [Gammaproteobacteria bacterium]
MTEAENQGAQPQNTNEKKFSIQKIYTKDISFETPNSPQIFTEQWQPEVGLQIGNAAKVINDKVHEVVLTLTVTVKLGEKTAYLAEVHQAGIFDVEGFDDSEKGAMLGRYCPNILFPYAREVVSDLVSKGGFPQMVLAPINFDALYEQHAQQMKDRASDSDTTH